MALSHRAKFQLIINFFRVKAIFTGLKSKKLAQSLHPYWNVRSDLLISEDGFILKGVRLVIPKSLRQMVLKDLHAGHRGIEGFQSKSQARCVLAPIRQ